MTKEVVNGQQVKTVVQGREKNHAIELLRFFFALFIIGYHTGTIYATQLGFNTVNWMAGAGEILFVFTLTAGYFLVSHFKRLQANPEYTARSASGRAWEYLWGRIKALLPVLALGIILGVISMTIWNGYTFQFAFMSVVNGLWEFLGLYSAGFNAGLGQANGALWFISSLLIVSYFLYYVLCKNEDLMRGFLAPFLFVFFGGWWAYTNTRAAQGGWSTFGIQFTNGSSAAKGVGKMGDATAAAIGINNGLLFVLIGMTAGILIYYAVQKLKTINWTVTKRTILTVVFTVALVALVLYTINPTWLSGAYSISAGSKYLDETTGKLVTTVMPGSNNFYRWTVHLLCIIVVGCILLNEDYLTKLLNNKYTAKVFDFMGGTALYMYILHCPFIFFVPQWFGAVYNTTTRTLEGLTMADGVLTTETTLYNFWGLYLIVAAIAIVLGAVAKILMDRYVLGKRGTKAVTTNATIAPAKVENKVVATTATKAPAKKAPAKKSAAKAPAKKVETKTTTKAPAKKTTVNATAKKPAAKTAAKAPAKKSTTAKKTTKK